MNDGVFLQKLRIWNFRSFGTKGDDLAVNKENPGIEVTLNPKLNVLIGENDSGKTAIIDAIRYVLGTRTYDNQRLDQNDFHFNKVGEQAEELKIVCLFKGFTSKQAGKFLEWIHTDEDGNYELRVWLSATLKDHKVVQNIRAGIDEDGAFLEGGARDLLRTTYLKPLRDAETELSPGYRSRLAQILLNHSVFIKEKDEDGIEKEHPLEARISEANEKIKEFFEHFEVDGGVEGGKEITEALKRHTKSFLHSTDSREPIFNVSEPYLPRILRKLGLELEEHKTGLGSLNKLFMAAELLQLEIEEGLRLALIEELEAHLHPQAQLRVINALRNIEAKTQFILSTHSTTLASNIPLENLILCYKEPDGSSIFSLQKEETGLEDDDYEFLYRFLDATKSNLFFARGVIIVEGDAENILLPTVARLLNRSLFRYGVSIVNVGSKALLRYVKIFRRSNSKSLPVNVAVVTDLDITQTKNDDGEIVQKKEELDKEEEIIKLENEYNSQEDSNIKVFSSPLWTLEFDMAKGELAPYVNKAVTIAHRIQNRVKRKDFSEIPKVKFVEWNEEAKRKLEGWKEDGLTQKEIAYEIYDELDRLASKTVTAQWLTRILKENEEEIKEIIMRDEQLKYIRDAIYHVTEFPDNEDNE
ncbi:AAA family ATPase [Aliifodinibius sp. S!AR15-10]|uniref:ATP-dependent nuclease n=1 Tax=Aliifodinibius sp. S!AR15-10 TaxID=2950437 RepID=UPI0028564424|nr:AAA family ATPase [Aliifodinibius sp. S!AR15-10]MDR8392247.1 AAA family ATPase [Aliifodinibius sp. S!AR15-10]